MRESKCAVCVGKHATGMKLYKKGNTLNTGQVFMPVGQEMVHGSTANVNYFHILTEQVHLPVYPAYSRSEVCFLPDENSRYDLFSLFFFFFLILLIHLEQGMGKVSPSRLIMVKCRTEVQKKFKKWETTSSEQWWACQHEAVQIDH